MIKTYGSVLFIMTVILFISGGCVNTTAVQGGVQWPTQDWATSTPAEQDMDPAVLDSMLEHVIETKLNLHSLLVIRNGYIIVEQYYPPFDQKSQKVLYSVTKSFTATLVGIALDQGKLKEVSQTVSTFLPGMTFANPDKRKDTMTVEDLLTMTSGLDWQEGDPSYQGMYNSADWVQWVMNLPVIDEPGNSFRYCSGCSHVLSAVVEQATGMDGVDFARKYLFEPLGIRKFRWEKDAEDIPIGGWGLTLTSRDMAKLGYLYLHGGRWEDTQVVSSDWVETATKERVKPEGRLGYGYQWWTYPTHRAYAALGRGGQTIFVIPDLNIIVVATAEIDGHDDIFYLIDNYVIPAAASSINTE